MVQSFCTPVLKGDSIVGYHMPEPVCKWLKLADILVEILAYYFNRPNCCVVPPKIHERLEIGISKSHGQFRIGLLIRGG